jgi:hypothetical protein
MCGDECCKDCFIEWNPLTQQEVPGTEFCFTPADGTICDYRKPGPGDDRACWPDEKCVKGKCCCDGCFGSVVCGGKCCPQDACCNGKCCKKGKVCAQKTLQDPLTCVSVNRSCTGAANCYVDEQCIDGVCCGGNRICSHPNLGNFCCGAGKYCDFVGPNGTCCPINRLCNSYRAHRVRV